MSDHPVVVLEPAAQQLVEARASVDQATSFLRAALAAK